MATFICLYRDGRITRVERPSCYCSAALVARRYWLVPGTDPEDPLYVI